MDRHEPPHGEFERVAELFEEARALSAEERGAWLTRLASAEPRLAEQVRRLLGHHEADEAAVDTLKTTWRDHVAEGASFGPYTIVRELGRGGMGVVYLADQTEPLKRRVALKVIQAGLWGPDVARRFDRERQTLARLVHPGIAQVHDAGVTDDGRPYVVLEYVDGEPIHTFAREHELDLPARLELFVDVCRAVEFAHQKGVIHRDLKPGNILVTMVDGRPQPKIIDFGIAKVVDDEGAARDQLTELTLAGAVVGTPAYMSPEQALHGSDTLDTRTDIYSLGVILYELLSGSLPFAPEKLREAGPVELRRIFVEDEPRPPSTRAREAGAVETRAIASRLQGDLDWITMKALAKERERRYSSAGALADDIGRYLADEPVEARPPSRAYRLRKFAARHRTGLVASVLLLLSLVAGLVASTTLFFQAESARSLAEVRLAEVERTADLQRLAALTAEADELWPAAPASEARLADWMRRARAVTARLPAYRERLAALRVQGTPIERPVDEAAREQLDLLRQEQLAKLRELASYLPGDDMAPPADDLEPKPVVFFARHELDLPEPPSRPLDFRLHAFDGVQLLLNGTEIARLNLPAGELAADMPSLGPPPPRTVRGRVDPALFVAGRNVLAARVHLRAPGTPRMQLTFDMDGPAGAHLVPIDAVWRVQPPGEAPVEGWSLPTTEVAWPQHVGPVGFAPWDRYPPHVQAAAERLRTAVAGVRARMAPFEAQLARRQGWRFEDPGLQSEHDELEQLVRAYEAFEALDPVGPVASVDERLATVAALREQARATAPAWQRVRAEVAADERFAGLDVAPQVGLIPLGRDATSGLQEFAVFGSGVVPKRGDDGALVRDPKHGAVVMVLIPGGTTTIGAARGRPGAATGEAAPHVDDEASLAEGPVHDVLLDPFFLSKYEMTQGQWQDLMGENPSSWPVGQRAGEVTVTEAHPVESIPWQDVRRALRRLGLVLPTEVQWEHAVRAGTSTPWWCGATQASLPGNLNIADASVIRNRETWAGNAWNELDDGYVIHAPVGTFPASPWGLHETLGNVREWCLDRYGTYEGPARPGDGLRMEHYEADLIVTRGGSYSSRVIQSRVSARGRTNADLAETWVGIRPARAIDR